MCTPLSTLPATNVGREARFGLRLSRDLSLDKAGRSREGIDGHEPLPNMARLPEANWDGGKALAMAFEGGIVHDAVVFLLTLPELLNNEEDIILIVFVLPSVTATRQLLRGRAWWKQ